MELRSTAVRIGNYTGKNTPENFRAKVLGKGDTDGRRDEYLKAKCRELHGLPKDFDRSVKATEIRRASMAAKKADKQAAWLRGQDTERAMAGNGQASIRGGPPRFDRDYWERYWRDNPKELPDLGSNAEECFENFRAYINSHGDTDPRRHEYLKAKCRKLHGVGNGPIASVMAVRSRTAVQAAGDEAGGNVVKNQKASQFSSEARKVAPERMNEVPIARRLGIQTLPDGSPYFSRGYWERIWKLHPEAMPPIGENVAECLSNFKAFVRARGDGDDRRNIYLKAKCQELHRLRDGINADSRTFNGGEASQERSIAGDYAWQTRGKQSTAQKESTNSEREITDVQQGNLRNAPNALNAAVTSGAELMKSRLLALLNVISNAARNSNLPIFSLGSGPAVPLPQLLP
ncbi:MAG: hypothetical protein M1816_006374 [Peltula sp. TS41687]|nr:MAG: hypothetical protein M1816_006374 [Peltula sp. TS41687]